MKKWLVESSRLITPTATMLSLLPSESPELM